VRRGYVAAFSIPAPGSQDADVGGERLVVVAERAARTNGVDPAAALEAIRSAISERHGLAVHDVRVLPAGAIPGRPAASSLAEPVGPNISRERGTDGL
jgi:fatty-acyl-CoA synthase